MNALQLLAQRAVSAMACDALVPSPCSSVCRMSADSGWCEGCLRSVHEIARWSVLDDAEKRLVWQEISQRIEQLTRKHP